MDFSGSLDEHEVEEAVLKGFEKKEGRKLYDCKAMKEDENKTYSYNDLKEEDCEDDEDDGEAMDSFLSTLVPGDSSKDEGKGGLRDNADHVSEKPRKTQKPVKPKSIIADFDEFQHILETSGMDKENKWDIHGDDRRDRNFKQPGGGHEHPQEVRKAIKEVIQPYFQINYGISTTQTGKKQIRLFPSFFGSGSPFSTSLLGQFRSYKLELRCVERLSH